VFESRVPMGWGVIVQCGGSGTALLTKRYPADKIKNEMGGTRDVG